MGTLHLPGYLIIYILLGHHYVKKVSVHSCIDLDSFYIPGDVPGPKLDLNIFTIKKRRKILNFEFGLSLPTSFLMQSWAG